MFDQPPSPSQYHANAIAQQVQIPEGLSELVDATWQFQNNWGWKDVKLHHPSKTAMLDVSQMFKSMEGQILKPPIRQAKLDSEVGPGDSASQVAPSTASSKASMQPTAAPVLDNTPSKLNPAKFRKVLKAQEECRVPAPPSGSGVAALAESPATR